LFASAPSASPSAAAAPSSLPKYLLSVPRLRETTLDNGFRVASEDTASETATVGIWIDAGSASETSESNGVAHFLEHMAFKGTQKRSKTDIEVEIENMGAQLNAYTSREQTVYYAQCLKQDVAKAVDILADIVTHSKLADTHVEAERSVILQEKESVESNPEEVLFDYLHAAAYQGTPLGRTILGPERNIKSIGATELRHYIDAHYRPSRMALVAAGGVRHEELVAAAHSAFGDLVAGAPAAPRRQPAFTGSEIRLRDDLMPHAHVAIAYEGVGWRSADFYTFQVIQAIVGHWSRSSPQAQNSSSHLAEEIATDRIATSFAAFHTPYNETALFGVHFVAESDHLDDTAHAVIKEFVRIAYDVTDSEVERAKNAVKAALLLSLDGTSPNAEEIGRQLIAIGRRIPPAEMWARVDSITPADVKRVAVEYLTDTDIAVAAIGQTLNLPDYNLLRTKTRKGLL
jgi:processing peptidase subunit beta